jgi:hypothetical protein
VKCGYYKPYGDHLVYSKKDINDMDAMVFHEWLNLTNGTKECTLGFDPDKILSHWNPEELTGALKKNFDTISEGMDMVLVESGRNFSFGGFMGMDSITLAETFGSDVLLVAEGDVHLILDKVLAVQKSLEGRAKLKGIVINKVDAGTVVDYYKGTLLKGVENFNGTWNAGSADATIACIGNSRFLEGENGDALLNKNGGDRTGLRLPQNQINFIKKLRKEAKDKPLIVVITGGSAILPGMPELAEQIFNLPVRRGNPLDIGGLTDAVNSPIYATGVGLVKYGVIFYALKKVPYFHAIWHLFVLAGSLSHFMGMLLFLT